jgi:hypothetical protein
MWKHLLLAATALAPFALAQPVAGPERRLSFEVASLKPAADSSQGGIIRPMRGNQSYVATNMPLRLLIRIAYGVTDRQLSGGPSWVGTETFDMDAKADKPVSVDDLHLMLRSLLEERFQLKVHREQREQAVYALTVDKGGPKMKVHEPVETDYPPIRGGGPGERVASYDFALHWVPDRPVREGGEPLPDGPTVFAALKDQLGLKLEPAKGPVEYLVIDRVEKLSGN